MEAGRKWLIGRGALAGELRPAVLEPCVQEEAPTIASAHNRFKLLYLGRIESYKGIFEAMEILAG